MLQVGIQVFIFAGVEFVKCIRMVDIERRDESGFGECAFILQFFWVLLQHSFAARSYADEFNIPFEPVDEHRQFVQPVLTEDSSPVRDAPIVITFVGDIHSSSLIKDILLDILGVWVHSAELIEVANLFIFAYAREFDKWSVYFHGLLCIWLRVSSSEHVFDVSHGNDLFDLKTAVVESSEHFGFAQCAFASLGEVVVESGHEQQTWEDTAVNEPADVDDVVNAFGIGA